MTARTHHQKGQAMKIPTATVHSPYGADTPQGRAWLHGLGEGMRVTHIGRDYTDARNSITTAALWLGFSLPASALGLLAGNWLGWAWLAGAAFWAAALIWAARDARRLRRELEDA